MSQLSSQLNLHEEAIHGLLSSARLTQRWAFQSFIINT